MPTPCLGRDASKKVCALPTNSHRSTRLELVHPIPHSRINNETMTSLKLACKQISPTMNFFWQGILQLFDHPCTKGWERYTTTDRCEIWGYLATEWPRSIVLLLDPKTPNPSDENAPLLRPDAWPNATRQANFLLIWSTFLEVYVKNVPFMSEIWCSCQMAVTSLQTEK